MGSGPDFDQLERAIDGDVIVIDGSAWQEWPKPFNARYDRTRPRAVVRWWSAGHVG